MRKNKSEKKWGPAFLCGDCEVVRKKDFSKNKVPNSIVIRVTSDSLTSRRLMLAHDTMTLSHREERRLSAPLQTPRLFSTTPDECFHRLGKNYLV